MPLAQSLLAMPGDRRRCTPSRSRSRSQHRAAPVDPVLAPPFADVQAGAIVMLVHMLMQVAPAERVQWIVAVMENLRQLAELHPVDELAGSRPGALPWGAPGPR